MTDLARRRLDLLRRGARRASCFVAIQERPARPARLGSWPVALAEEVRAAAARLGLPQPYCHQSEAIAAVLDGRDVVVATGTASGKSLAYVVPVLHALVTRPTARALLLFPTKALARDQLEALRAWQDAIPGLDLSAATYDGDTPGAARARARRAARVVLTNPDMLHAGILPRHADWSALFQGLELVVLDEAHAYRGVFGSHVANVLRRLQRVARFHGARPRFVLTSATIGNPRYLASALIGRPVALVADDGSPAGPRTLAVYNPPLVDRRLGIRRSVLLEAEALARHFVAGGVQTIVFAQSRQAAELIVRYMSDALAAAGHPTAGGLTVRGYRAGYTPTERRRTESDLRAGRLRAVVATNALELGIDIGQLDACVIAGYPGSIASARQQAGRAGRRTAHAAVVLVAGSAPIDQYVARHPEFLLAGSPEHARIDPDNLLVLLDHVRCAAFELPFGDAEAALPLGAACPEPPPATPSASPPVADMLAVLASRGEVRHTAGIWYWLAEPGPAARVGLRSTGPDLVSIVRGPAPEDTAEPQAADVLGTIDRTAAPATVHPGAIYLHDGRSYEVVALDWPAGRATVRPSDGTEYTRASSRTDLTPVAVVDTRPATGALVHHGQLEVRRRVTGYRRVRLRTHETFGWGRVDLPEQVHVAGGYWFTLDQTAREALRQLGHWPHDPAADRGPDWSDRRLRALERDGHRCRLCSAPERDGRSHDVHHIRPFADFGWVKGANDRHREANDLANLITLCPACHSIAERALGLHTALGGLGHALRHMAALFLMCDARDLDVSAEAHAPWTGLPTLAVHERSAGGVGFGAALFDRHEALLAACRDLVAGCACTAGCPACVGPVEERGPDARAHALAVLDALGAGTGP